MVFYRERANERPPLSLILPLLYLGAESDVTQESLSARGISYVLSVSRCSPQPTFLPISQFLRIPIDDSLRDDLLPWIPGALRFIDGAMSSGGAVLVHCAAGISRSPALAVAYIMYRMGMDLDHAYRFVKERRPSISPNFNFLGQLQHFQGTLLSGKSSDGSLVIQPLNACPQSNSGHSPTTPSAGPGLDYQGNHVAGDSPTVEQARAETSSGMDKAELPCFRWGEGGRGSDFPGNARQEEGKSRSSPSATLALRNLNLVLNLNRNAQTSCESPSLSPCGPAKPLPKPTQLQLPVGHASLFEKRKSLTLSLSPMVSTPSPASTHNKQKAMTLETDGMAPSPDQQTVQISSTKSVHKRERGARHEVKMHSDEPAGGVLESTLPAASQREWSSSASTSCRKSARPAHGYAQSPIQKEREGRAQGKGRRASGCAHSMAKKVEVQRAIQKMGSRGEAGRGECSGTIVDQQPSTETKKTSSATPGPEENVVENQGPLSPLNLTINKLLGWGERMLLGVLLGPQIKMGQAALPYRC